MNPVVIRFLILDSSGSYFHKGLVGSTCGLLAIVDCVEDLRGMMLFYSPLSASPSSNANAWLYTFGHRKSSSWIDVCVPEFTIWLSTPHNLRMFRRFAAVVVKAFISDMVSQLPLPKFTRSRRNKPTVFDSPPESLPVEFVQASDDWKSVVPSISLPPSLEVYLETVFGPSDLPYKLAQIVHKLQAHSEWMWGLECQRWSFCHSWICYIGCYIGCCLTLWFIGAYYYQKLNGCWQTYHLHISILTLLFRPFILIITLNVFSQWIFIL